jgi:hypothetical protein
MELVVERSAFKFVDELPEFDDLKRAFRPVVLPAHN